MKVVQPSFTGFYRVFLGSSRQRCLQVLLGLPSFFLIFILLWMMMMRDDVGGWGVGGGGGGRYGDASRWLAGGHGRRRLPTNHRLRRGSFSVFLRLLFPSFSLSSSSFLLSFFFLPSSFSPESRKPGKNSVNWYFCFFFKATSPIGQPENSVETR